MKIIIPKMSIGSWVKFEFLDERDRPTYALNAHTGERVWGGWWYPNLITDQGLDGLAQTNSISLYVSNSFSLQRGDKPGIRQCLGLFTGSLGVKRPSGSITLSQSGNTITASAAFFQLEDVGSEIVWDNVTRAKITAFVSETSVTVADSKTVSAAPATLYAVGLTSVPSEVQTGNSNGGFTGMLTSYASGNDLVYEYTIPTVITLSANQNLTGFRFGPSCENSAHIVENFRDSSGNPITVSVLSGKKVRIDHMLQLRTSSVAQSANINLLDYDVSNNLIDTIALTANYKTRWASTQFSEFYRLFIYPLNPASTSFNACSLASNTETLESINWTRVNSIVELEDYSAGSFQRNKNIYVGESQGNGNWIGFALDYDSAYLPGDSHGVRVIVSPGFSKNNNQQMIFSFALSWGREYV